MAGLSVQRTCAGLLRSRWPRATGTFHGSTIQIQRRCSQRPISQTARLATATTTVAADDAGKSNAPIIPLRKQVKEQAKAEKAAGNKRKKASQSQTVKGWELTVGIEIHAQLNTERKLFSPALTSFNDEPNSHAAYFDAALPGAQPIFQPETLIPAIRAALALHCEIQPVSRFDRKHYFHWDQPTGYQITQYYEPFARSGHIMLYERDGIAPQDGKSIRIDIQQVQMEQDTAKTIAQPGGEHWLDLNRVGTPLIEIITRPQIHYPATAAALVRKIQLLLYAVNACTLGMEAGGLRADVNVSVRRSDDLFAPLGTRTEIKNLNSFRAVEDAIIAERNRQIHEITSSGNAKAITSETRGWTPGQHGGETHRLRGKEGEVDYRYMPDPDLGPVLIDQALVDHLAQSSGVLPDAEVDDLVANYGLSTKDALTLVSLDNGGRAQYYYDVVDAFEDRLQKQQYEKADPLAYRSLVANWVLHQLGKLTSDRNSNLEGDRNDLEMTSEGQCRIPVKDLAELLVCRFQGRITNSVAKDLLFAIFRGEIGEGNSDGVIPQYANVIDAIDKNKLWFQEISQAKYDRLALEATYGEEKILDMFLPNSRKKNYPQGKLQYLIGKMMRKGPEGQMDPEHAEQAMKAAIQRYVDRFTKK